MKKSKFAVIIPARYESKRLPGKPLANVIGETLIYRMYKIAFMVTDRVIVATDDVRIYERVKGFKVPDGVIIEVIFSNEKYANGTDRCAGVVRTCEENRLIKPLPDIIVNLQCDMPFINPQLIKLAAENTHKTGNISTLYYESQDYRQFVNPNNVKIVTGIAGNALYFSRSPIPYQMDDFTSFKKHIGVYAFRKNTLHCISDLEDPGFGEEDLEQNKWLYHQYEIDLVRVNEDVASVNTKKDLDFLNKLKKL